MKKHHYKTVVTWKGNTGSGTRTYKGYERTHVITVTDKPEIPASSDPSFRGDKSRYNPEELFVASLSSCHMLWYLHLCSQAGVIVTDYEVNATAIMEEKEDGSGKFISVTLHPVVTVTDDAMIEKANSLHHKANSMCFIANSVKMPVYHQPVCKVAEVV